jgi:hypothetical protein
MGPRPVSLASSSLPRNRLDASCTVVGYAEEMATDNRGLERGDAERLRRGDAERLELFFSMIPLLLLAGLVALLFFAPL